MREVVAAVARNAKGAFFLARRASHLKEPGCWEFPGGKVEAGEGAREALARELREELYWSVEVGPELYRLDWPLETQKIRLRFFAVHSHLAPVGGVAHDAWNWFSPEALSQLPLLPADAAAWPFLKAQFTG